MAEQDHGVEAERRKRAVWEELKQTLGDQEVLPDDWTKTDQGDLSSVINKARLVAK